ncbi:MAG: 2-dehydropantoate 2-reductase [Armatimonadetes bacterium]|nr:2-dehydropantoate 2-reductase [Armatimonadota bacterium]
MADILIVGPGAMGCLHAALLAEAGVEVALLDYRPDRAERLRTEGIMLRWSDGSIKRVPLPVSASASQIGSAGFIVLMVKAYSTASAALHGAAAATDDTVWVTLQNGLGNVESIREALPQARILAGVTTSGANLSGERMVNVAGIGTTTVGPACATDVEDAERFAQLWRLAFPTEVVPDPTPAIWRKLIVNAAINPLGAITGLRNGELMEVPQLRALALAIAREADRVAHRLGVDVGDDFDPAGAVESVCRATAANRCSMLQDVESRRRTEVDYINGAVARVAPPDAPAILNAAVTELVKAIERGI